MTAPYDIANREDSPAVSGSVQRLVRLIQCERRSCGHVLIEDERAWIPHPEWAGAMRAVCPKCADYGFYTLNEKGQAIGIKDLDKYRNGIDPETIDPSPRMGLKMKRRILAAKRRAIEANAQAD